MLRPGISLIRRMALCDVMPPGETGSTLTLAEVSCLIAALDFYMEARWLRMPRAGSAAYHALSGPFGVAYVLRGRLGRREVELARLRSDGDAV